MKEDLLHFIWQTKRLFTQALYTTDQRELHILQPGTYNPDAGPDFFNAKIKLDQTLWAGNIEMHIRSSDWNLHGHQHDKNYDNVILHVVYHHDREIQYTNGLPVPTLELKQLLPPSLLQRYQKLKQVHKHIPCEDQFQLPESFKLQAWLTRLLTERLEQKTDVFRQLLTQTRNDWEQAFYIYSARYFGMKTNALPFEWLARELPVSVLGKHRDNLFQIQSLVLGMSGLTQRFNNDEWAAYHNEFQYLSKKYNLTPLQASVWKFAKTRPQNFPDIRLKQFSRLIFQTSHLFSKLKEADTLDKLRNLYRFEEDNKQILSDSTIDLLLINSVIPVLFLYGKLHAEPEVCERAFVFLEQMEPEQNAIIRLWKKLGIKPQHAFDAQALIQLKTVYCDTTRCLECVIGNELLLKDTI